MTSLLPFRGLNDVRSGHRRHPAHHDAGLLEIEDGIDNVRHLTQAVPMLPRK